MSARPLKVHGIRSRAPADGAIETECGNRATPIIGEPDTFKMMLGAKFKAVEFDRADQVTCNLCAAWFKARK